MAIVCLQSACYLLLVHVVITKGGFIFVRAESLNEGHEQLLNSLDESVVIFNESDNAVVFSNKSA